MREAAARNDDRDAPRDAAALLGAAQRAETLAELTELFAAAIARDGFSAHFCVTISDQGTPELLFGDVARPPLALVRGGTIGALRGVAPGHLVLGVGSWHRAELFLCLAGAHIVTAEIRARLQGLAEIYACFGLALFERESDAATAAGLGVAQRHCLALLLAGRRDPEIADALGITPLAVRGHIDKAVEILGVATRVEAVALAARRGWLAGLARVAPSASDKIPKNMIN